VSEVTKKRRHRHKFRVPVPPGTLFTLACFVRLWKWTLRTRVEDSPGFLTEGGPWPVICVSWHNRIPLLAPFFPPRLQSKSWVLASASRDGEYAAAFFRHFALRAVRGSVSRRGFESYLELKGLLAGGNTVMLTVDGPRGPRYSVHPGAVLLAEQTGAPIMPVSVNAPSRWELRSWDRTQLPRPFSRAKFVIGPLIHVAPGLTAEGRKDECERLRQAMLAITED
jgi:lysophospholipid acyltransferase (LPLAT)-like uncharacterized protein